MNPQGKVALITGGARMGHAVATLLAQKGCEIAVAYRRSKASARQIREDVTALGVRVLLVKSDVSHSAQVKELVKTVCDHFGRLDILVHMASIYERTPMADVSKKDWQANVRVHIESTHALVSHALPALRRGGGGRIVLVSDWTAASGRPRYKDYLPYYVSKAGVKALTEGLALELAPAVLVNAIAPGPMIPPPGLTKKAYDAVKRATPLGRWGGAQEAAKAVVFLVQTDFVTGEVIRVDGGRHLF